MKKSHIFHVDSLSILDKMTNEQAGEFIKSAYYYMVYGELPTCSFAIEMALAPFVNQWCRDAEKWTAVREKRIEAGAKGGKQKLANASKSKQETLVNVNVNDNVNVSVNVNENVNIPFGDFYFVVTWEGTDNPDMEESDFYRISLWVRSGITGRMTESTTLAGYVQLRNAVEQTFIVNRDSIEVFENEYIVLKTTFSETEILDCVFEIYELADIPANSYDTIYTHIARIDAEHIVTQIFSPNTGVIFTWRIGAY